MVDSNMKIRDRQRQPEWFKFKFQSNNCFLKISWNITNRTWINLFNYYGLYFELLNVHIVKNSFSSSVSAEIVGVLSSPYWSNIIRLLDISSCTRCLTAPAASIGRCWQPLQPSWRAVSWSPLLFISSSSPLSPSPKLWCSWQWLSWYPSLPAWPWSSPPCWGWSAAPCRIQHTWWWYPTWQWYCQYNHSNHII